MRYFFESKVEKRMPDIPFRFLLMYGKYVIREKASREISFWITISSSVSFIPRRRAITRS